MEQSKKTGLSTMPKDEGSFQSGGHLSADSYINVGDGNRECDDPGCTVEINYDNNASIFDNYFVVPQLVWYGHSYPEFGTPTTSMQITKDFTLFHKNNHAFANRDITWTFLRINTHATSNIPCFDVSNTMVSSEYQ